MGRTKGRTNKVHGKTGKVQCVKFVQYHLDFVKHSDNEYAVHVCWDAHNRFGFSSGFISMSR